MPKKQWTPEEREAFAKKMKDARRASTLKDKKPTQTKTINKTNGDDNLLLETLIKMVDTLQSQINQPKVEDTNQYHGRNQGVNISHAGDITGIINKYPIEKDFYPDPTDELLEFSDKHLPAIAFRTNYDLLWDVTSHPYETANHVWYNEPWHVLQVDKRMFNEQGEPVVDKESGEEIVIKWRIGYFFEDEVMVAQEANRLGIKDFDANELANKIRIERMKRQLKDWFYPSKPKATQSDKQVVVNGQVVIQTSRSKLLDSLPSASSIRI